VDWIYLAQDRQKWRAVVKWAKKLELYEMQEKFLAS